MEELKPFIEKVIEEESVCDVKNDFSNGSLIIKLGVMICVDECNEIETRLKIEFRYEMKFTSSLPSNPVYYYKNVFISDSDRKSVSLDYLKKYSKYLYHKFLENLKMDCHLKENGFVPIIGVLREEPFYLSDTMAIQILEKHNTYFEDSQSY